MKVDGDKFADDLEAALREALSLELLADMEADLDNKAKANRLYAKARKIRKAWNLPEQVKP